jgi:DNA-binding transcriptional ArsR family regulator
MVKYSEAALDATFGALADPTRRAILARLAMGETTLQDLAAPYPMSLVAVMKHVRVLERADLVRTEKSGRVRRCRFSPAPLRNAAEWIRFYQAFWEQQFDSLEDYLSRPKKERR